MAYINNKICSGLTFSEQCVSTETCDPRNLEIKFDMDRWSREQGHNLIDPANFRSVQDGVHNCENWAYWFGYTETFCCGAVYFNGQFESVKMFKDSSVRDAYPIQFNGGQVALSAVIIGDKGAVGGAGKGGSGGDSDQAGLLSTGIAMIVAMTAIMQ